MPQDLRLTDILIANNDENLDYLDSALSGKDEEAVGLALGIPQTAVEAYIGKRKRLNKDDLPDEVKRSDAAKFCKPILSADNWQEEIKLWQKYADLTKRVSPAIYHELLLTAEAAENLRKK